MAVVDLVLDTGKQCYALRSPTVSHPLRHVEPEIKRFELLHRIPDEPVMALGFFVRTS